MITRLTLLFFYNKLLIDYYYFFCLDITECKYSTCNGQGECIEIVGGGTECVCNPGYTSENCSLSKCNVHVDNLSKHCFLRYLRHLLTSL